MHVGNVNSLNILQVDANFLDEFASSIRRTNSEMIAHLFDDRIVEFGVLQLAFSHQWM